MRRVPRCFRSVVILATAISGLLAASSTAVAGSVTTPLVYTGGPIGHGAFQRRPSNVVYSGDGAAFIAGLPTTRSHLVWTTYTRQGARATGADWLNDCTPDCVDGTFHSYFAKIHLYRPQRVDGYRTFTRMTVHVLSTSLPPYPAAKRFTTYRLHFLTSGYGPTFFWETSG